MTLQRSQVQVDSVAGGEPGDALIGTTIGHSVIEGLLGRGGMGTVYLARHRTLQKLVAVKVLRRDLPSDFKAAQRFLREARAAAQLEHPNIVHVLDAGEDAGQKYIVMQYVPGESLATRLRREGVLSASEALRIFRAIAAGIRHAHSRGFIHRDIKPDNVLLGEAGEVKITDFGLARAVEGDPNLSRTGTVLGSPNFMSPEQAVGSRVDRRTDLYSLGATLYQMVVGAPPFQADTTLGIMYKVVREPLAPPHAVSPKVPLPLSRYICLLMRKDPRRRPATVDQCLEILQEVEASLKVAGLRLWRSRAVRAATFAAGAALLALGVFLGPWTRSSWGGGTVGPNPAVDPEMDAAADPEVDAEVDPEVDPANTQRGPLPRIRAAVRRAVERRSAGQ